MDVRSVLLVSSLVALFCGVHATGRDLQMTSVAANFEMHVGGVRVESGRVSIPAPREGSDSNEGMDWIIVPVKFEKPFYKEPFISLNLEQYVSTEGPTCWAYELHDATNEGFDLYFKNPCFFRFSSACVLSGLQELKS